MNRSLRGSIILMLVTALSASPWTAEGAQICPAGQPPPLGAAFTTLSAQLGMAMGTPIECAHTDRNTGNEAQQTTTGVAVYQHEQRIATFTNGYDFWRLSQEGLTQWHGWHGSAGPAAPTSTADVIDVRLALSSIGQYSRVEAATVVQALGGEQPHLVLQHDGRSVDVEVGDGCLHGQPPSGRVVFVISQAAFAEPGDRLVFEVGGRECLITANRPLSSKRDE